MEVRPVDGADLLVSFEGVVVVPVVPLCLGRRGVDLEGLTLPFDAKYSELVVSSTGIGVASFLIFLGLFFFGFVSMTSSSLSSEITFRVRCFLADFASFW